MTPKKPKEMIKEVAAQRGIPEAHMAMMVKGFYKELKRKMEELETPKIQIIGLGSMEASRGTVKKAIEKFRRMRASKKNSTVVETSEEKLNKLYGMEELLDKQYQEIGDRWRERGKERDIIKQKLKDDAERNTATGME